MRGKGRAIKNALTAIRAHEVECKSSRREDKLTTLAEFTETINACNFIVTTALARGMDKVAAAEVNNQIATIEKYIADYSRLVEIPVTPLQPIFVQLRVALGS